MNDDETRSLPWQQPDDEPTRMTSVEPGPARGGSAVSDDWYRSSQDDLARYGASTDPQITEPQNYGSHGGYGTRGGHPSAPYASSDHPTLGSYGSFSEAPRSAAQSQSPQKRRAWVMPAALGVVALVSFGTVTALMSKDSSPEQAAPAAVSNSASQSASSSSPSQSSSSTSPSASRQPEESTTSTAPSAVPSSASQATSQQTAVPTTSTPSSAAPTVAAFPDGATTFCETVTGGSSTITDPDIRQTTSNSCDFLSRVKDAAWAHEASSSETPFDLSVYSAFRARQNETKSADEKEDPMVPITCYHSGGLSNCRSNARTGNQKIDIWVRDAP